MLYIYLLLLLCNNCILSFISIPLLYSFFTIILSKLYNQIIYKNYNLYIIPKKIIFFKIRLQHYVYKIFNIYLLLEISYLSTIISKISLPYSVQLFNKINSNNLYIVKASLTSEQKDVLLYLHRKTREAVQATNMQPLYWSSTLAYEAEVIIYLIIILIFFLIVIIIIGIGISNNIIISIIICNDIIITIIFKSNI